MIPADAVTIKKPARKGLLRTHRTVVLPHAPRHDLQRVIDQGSLKPIASAADALSQTSISPSLVKMTGMVFVWDRGEKGVRLSRQEREHAQGIRLQLAS